jgi:hypothetical protein
MTWPPRILILVPWFGPWPPWIEFFLTTCRWNQTVDWLFLGDHGPPGALADNLRYEPLDLPGLRAHAERTLGYAVALRDPYKVCDLRLAFGRVFSEHLVSYDVFGWSDLDVIYGDLRRFLTEDVLRHDVISFNQEHLSGHLTLVRNTSRARRLHETLASFVAGVGQATYQHLDEPHPSELAGIDVYARESFNTPLSKLIPWRDGRFVFPTEWRWHDGSLQNDLDHDVEFTYLHFMHWKGGPWPRECGNAQWERVQTILHVDPTRAGDGFRVNETGFHPLR